MKLIKTEFSKVCSSWVKKEVTEQTVDMQFYNNVLSSKRFFQSLGGKEKHTNTANGLKKVESISPDNSTKMVYEFFK